MFASAFPGQTRPAGVPIDFTPYQYKPEGAGSQIKTRNGRPLGAPVRTDLPLHDFTGVSNHAGTTPMRLRHDAGYAAAAIACETRRLTGLFRGTCRV